MNNYFSSRDSVLSTSRKTQNAANFQMETLEAAAWVSMTLGKDFAGHSVEKLNVARPGSSAATVIDQQIDNFMTYIQNGAALCLLLNKINPALNVKYKDQAAVGSFQARDNVTNFVKGCATLGVPNPVLMEADDLVTRRNDRAVITMLLSLARVAAVNLKVQPPEMISAELEIDQQEQNAEDEDEDEDDAQSSNNAVEEPQEQPVVVAVAEAVVVEPAVAESPVAPADAGEGKPEGAELGVVPEDEEVSGDAAQSARSQRKQQYRLQKEKEEKEEKDKEEQQARERAERSRSARTRSRGVSGASQDGGAPQIPVAKELLTSVVDENVASVGPTPQNFEPFVVDGPMDAIDKAIAALVNTNKLVVTIRKYVPKSKKKQNSKTRGGLEGQYQIGLGERVAVRVVRNVVMVRTGGQWIDLVTYIEQKAERGINVIPH